MNPENELPEEENHNDTESSKHITNDVPAFLCSVNNHTEADMIEALLKSNHIPVWRKLRSGGDIAMVYMAVSFSGADIYVPSKLLESAKMLLSDDLPTDEADEDENFDDFFELSVQRMNQRRTRARLLLALFVILLLPLLFALGNVLIDMIG